MLISMEAKAATNIFAIKTVFGCVPALLNTNVARRLSILHLDRAAARVKPPMSSMMTGVHIAAKMAEVASFEFSLVGGLPGSSSHTTLRRTDKKGISSEVTKRGMVWDH